MTSRSWLAIAALNGALAVALGAYGAHSLDQGSPDLANLWAKATRYHMWHALTLLGVAWAITQTDPTTWNRRLVQLSGALFIAGLILFCGGLYALALSARTTPAFVIPFGGLAFIAGWLALAASAMGRKSKLR